MSTCPALHVLRGAMGTDSRGKPVEPSCSYAYPGAPCGHCLNTKRARR